MVYACIPGSIGVVQKHCTGAYCPSTCSCYPSYSQSYRVRTPTRSTASTTVPGAPTLNTRLLQRVLIPKSKPGLSRKRPVQNSVPRQSTFSGSRFGPRHDPTVRNSRIGRSQKPESYEVRFPGAVMRVRDRIPARAAGLSLSLIWVLVKEFSLSYLNGDSRCVEAARGRCVVESSRLLSSRGHSDGTPVPPKPLKQLRRSEA